MTTHAPTLDAVFIKLQAFVQGIAGVGVPVIRGLGNRVPPPAGAYVAMTATLQARLSTNHDEYTDPYPTPGGVRTVTMPTKVDVQLDFFGPDAGDWANMAQALWRDDYGCAALAPTCQPLHADQASQAPFVTGEQQYQERWIVSAVLQYNPAIALSQEFADAATVGLINVDVEYPP